MAIIPAKSKSDETSFGRRLLAAARTKATEGALVGGLVALTGFGPEHWFTQAFRALHLPDLVARANAAGLDFRFGLVALGLAIVAVDILWRALREQSTATPTVERAPVSTNADAQPRLSQPSLALPDKPSIAVLPFQNLSDDPEQEYFAEGVVEDIITALSRFKSLFVIARNSSFAYKGKTIDTKQIGQELGVRYLLEGSIRKSSEQVRVTGQLIEATTGAHLWADRFDYPLDEIFSLQDKVTMSVVGAIAPRLLDARTESVVRKPSIEWEAYDRYLQAVKLQHQWTVDATLAAQDVLRDVIRLDPQFALAYARFAWGVQALRVQYQQPISEAQRIEALSLAEKALSLAGDDEVVLTSVVSVFAFLANDVQRGRQLAERAAAINPNMSGAWNMRGVMCLVLGEADIALDSFGRVIRLNPLDPRAIPLAMFGCSAACLFLEKYEESEIWVRKMLALNPTDIRGLFQLLGVLIAREKNDEAEATVALIKREHPNLRATQLRMTYRILRPDFMALVERSIARLNLPE